MFLLRDIFEVISMIFIYLSRSKFGYRLFTFMICSMAIETVVKYVYEKKLYYCINHSPIFIEKVIGSLSFHYNFYCTYYHNDSKRLWQISSTENFIHDISIILFIALSFSSMITFSEKSEHFLNEQSSFLWNSGIVC